MKFGGILILIVSFFTICFAGFKTFESLTHPIKYEQIIIATSQKYDLEPSLVSSLINVESSYSENAISNKNALGLMQIKLSTANYMCDIYSLKKVELNDLLKAEKNIEFGCRYLHYLKTKFEDMETVLASYNAGETVVRSWLKNSEYSLDGKSLKDIPYKETKNYVNKIKSNINFYKKIYKNSL